MVITTDNWILALLKNQNFAQGDFTYSVQFLQQIAIIYLNGINQFAL